MIPSTQRFVYETGSLEEFAKMLRLATEIMFPDYATRHLQISMRPGEHFKDGKASLSFTGVRGTNRPQYMYACTFSQSPNQESISTSSLATAVELAVRLVRTVSEPEYEKVCGPLAEGMGLGYRMAKEGHLEQKLDISLCSIQSPALYT